ncbi:MAG: DUF4174 domain-containing protein, partial [Pseudomonadota bacterium]
EASQLQPARWETRPLLIFTPSDTAADLSRQTTELANHAGGLTDRRMSVYIVEPRRVFTTFGGPVVRADPKALRRRFKVPDDAFRVILVGLDGGAKGMWDQPVASETLFNLIDGMPMRRQELRRRQDAQRNGGGG